MRKLGNIPRLHHFLTVLLCTCKRAATSPTVNREFVSSFPPLEILSVGYSVIEPSIPDHPFSDHKILPAHKRSSFLIYSIIKARILLKKDFCHTFLELG
jgi:hypothetical protein